MNLMHAVGLTWTEASNLRLWEISAMEEDLRDRETIRKNRERLS